MKNTNKFLLFSLIWSACIGISFQTKCKACPANSIPAVCKQLEFVETCPADEKHVCFTSIEDIGLGPLVTYKGCLAKSKSKLRVNKSYCYLDQESNLPPTPCTCGSDFCLESDKKLI